jgi:hypothetical protein
MNTAARTQNVLSEPERPAVRIRVTSQPAKPSFLVCDPFRREFVDETIERLFGRQASGDRHTWKPARVSEPPASAGG